MELVNAAIIAILHKEKRQHHQRGEMTRDQMRELAAKTLSNTEHAIEALKDELQRMAGHVVDGDHGIGSGNCEKAGVPDYHSMYSLKNIGLPPEELSCSSSSNSSSQESDTCGGGGGGGSDSK